MTTQSFRAFATLEWELLDPADWHTRTELDEHSVNTSRFGTIDSVVTRR